LVLALDFHSWYGSFGRFFVSLCGCEGFCIAYYIAVCVLGYFLFLQAFSGSIWVWRVFLLDTAYFHAMLIVCGVSVGVCIVRLFLTDDFVLPCEFGIEGAGC